MLQDLTILPPQTCYYLQFKCVSFHLPKAKICASRKCLYVKRCVEWVNKKQDGTNRRAVWIVKKAAKGKVEMDAGRTGKTDI